MTDQYHPDFSPEVELEIEQEQTKIHEKYWSQLAELNEAAAGRALYGNSPYFDSLIPPPARLPKKLGKILGSYASELFQVEASRYPESKYLTLWLNDLNHGILDSVMDRISNLPELDYHAPEHVMKSAVMRSLLQGTNRRLEGLPLVPQPSAKTQSKNSPPIRSARRTLVDKFISAVLDETGRKITRKEIWTVAGYKAATDFERFQRNDKRTTKAAVETFTRVLNMKSDVFIGVLDKKQVAK
jgi:hypothetical protein